MIFGPDDLRRLWPHYFSTYCIHDLHADCREVCKACGMPCLCDCHGAIDATSTPAGEEPE